MEKYMRAQLWVSFKMKTIAVSDVHKTEFILMAETFTFTFPCVEEFSLCEGGSPSLALPNACECIPLIG